MNIEGKLVTLRAIELEDLDLLVKWSNSPELWQHLGGWHFPYSKRSTEAYIKNIDHASMNRQMFAVEAHDIGLIGTYVLSDIDWKNRNAESGGMLGEVSSRGKNYAYDVGMTMMRYVFKELGLNRLGGEIIEYNARSLGLSTKKLGWQIEGRRIESIYRNGKFHDEILIGITHKQYDEFMKDNNYWDS
ncbi:GNAT family N-acetyltransferase [Psychrobacter fulvigenes]|uniref:GNAT family N-acetyltransferase n=1 Tax=Psychrobacter fulvigenes TaxID=533323 RepID=UPI00191B62C1|nr:GNAT family protein [Psychrobacter fulvigenes]